MVFGSVECTSRAQLDGADFYYCGSPGGFFGSRFRDGRPSRPWVPKNPHGPAARPLLFSFSYALGRTRTTDRHRSGGGHLCRGAINGPLVISLDHQSVPFWTRSADREAVTVHQPRSVTGIAAGEGQAIRSEGQAIRSRAGV